MHPGGLTALACSLLVGGSAGPGVTGSAARGCYDRAPHTVETVMLLQAPLMPESRSHAANASKGLSSHAQQRLNLHHT